MFGIPLEVISMLASTLLGGYMKMKADARQDERDRNMMTLKLLNKEEKSRKSAREYNTPSANWARKFIVMSLMCMAAFILIAPILFNQPTNVLYEAITLIVLKPLTSMLISLNVISISFCVLSPLQFLHPFFNRV